MLEETPSKDMLAALRSGDFTARQKMIAAHIELSTVIAYKMSKYSHHYRDDLISESYLGLVYAVDSAAHKLLDDNISPYIAGWCRQFILAFLYRNHLVRIPSSTTSRYKKCGKKLHIANIHELNGHTPTIGGCENLIDFREILNKSITCKEERDIVELRIQGYNDKAIGERLQRSTSYINKIRVGVRDRFDELES